MTCDEWDFWAGNPFWLNSSAVHNGVTFNCTAASHPARAICQDPLTTDERGNCAFACPLPTLTDSEYLSAKVMQGVLGWISWLTTLFLIASYAADPKLRRFPKCMVPMTAVSAHIISGGIVLPTLVGHDQIWCGGETLYVRPNGVQTLDQYFLPDYTFSFSISDLSFGTGPCTFQGSLIQFGFISVNLWWTAIALNMLVELVARKRLPTEKLWYRWTMFATYFVAVNGLSATLTIVPASAGAIEFASGATYCFIQEGAWQDATWFAPVGLSLLVGSTFFAASLVIIAVAMARLRSVKKMVEKWRILAFILLFMVLFVFVFAYNVQVESHKDDINSGYSAYFRCLVDSATSSCSLPDSVSNYDLVMLRGFAISSLGFFLSMIFINLDMLRFWWERVRGVVSAARGRSVAGLRNAWEGFVFDTAVTARTTEGSLSVTASSASNLSFADKDEEGEEGSECEYGDEGSDDGGGEEDGGDPIGGESYGDAGKGDARGVSASGARVGFRDEDQGSLNTNA